MNLVARFTHTSQIEERASTRLVLTIIILAVLAEPASAAPSPPLSGTQLIKLCSTDILTCEKLIALIVKTGIDAGQLPASRLQHRVPLFCAALSPGRLKALDDGISMNLIQLSAWL